MGRSHKETNTYRFQNFSDRILSKHIDVVHCKRKYDIEDGSFYFQAAFSKWIDLNLSVYFVDFTNELEKFSCHTFPEFVHNSDNILAVVKKHLIMENTEAMEPLLDLVVQIARDLGPDFYACFKDVFHILVGLLASNSDDADALEMVFEALAYLFKFQWRYLIQDIESVFSYISDLLADKYKPYIRKFAAECFAFLMRKVKNHGNLLQFLFSHLKHYPEKMEGIGQLLFEIINGSKNHLHSIYPEIFRQVLLKLSGESSNDPNGRLGEYLPLDLIEQTTCYLMKSCIVLKKPTQLSLLWSPFLDALCIDQDLQTTQEIEYDSRLLRLLNIWLVEKGMVPDCAAMAEVLLGMMKRLPHTITNEPYVACWPTLKCNLLTAVTSLLLYNGDGILLETVTRLASLAFSDKFDLKSIKDFMMSFIQSPLFEKVFLPEFLSYISWYFEVESKQGWNMILSMLAEIILMKNKMPTDGAEMDFFVIYPLDFAIKQNYFNCSISEAVMIANNHIVGIDKLNIVYSVLVFLPHVNLLEPITRATSIRQMLDGLVNSATCAFQECEPIEDSILCVVHQAIMSLLVLKSSVNITDVIAIGEILSLIRLNSQSYYLLHAADCFLSCVKQDLKMEHFVELYSMIEGNLAAPSSKHNSHNDGSIFYTAYLAEQVPLTFHDCRKRLMYLRRLDFNVSHSVLLQGQPYAIMPLLCLFGTLHCQMVLLWKPVIELITTYANGFCKDDFWVAFAKQLSLAAKKTAEPEMQTSVTQGTEFTTLLAQRVLAVQTSERPPDWVTFRNQLWHAMLSFPEKCEPKSRDIVPLFLHFLKNEFYASDLSVCFAQDISDGLKHDMKSENSNSTDTYAEEIKEILSTEKCDVDVSNSDCANCHITTSSGGEAVHANNPQKAAVLSDMKDAAKNKRKALIKSLLSHLELFSKLQNPVSFYKEAELRTVFLQLLQYPHYQVQAAAFSCIMTYKLPYLLPYREHFEGLLDDKTFKAEVVCFSLDEDITVIQPDHRDLMLPFLMRILYGKILSKVGNGSRGRMRLDVRRSIIFRFLGGCRSNEVQIFLDLVFAPFKSFITDNPRQMVTCCSSVNLRSIVPPKQMKAVLGSLQLVMRALGGSNLQGSAKSLLHVLLGIAATCSSCLPLRSHIKDSAVSTLKSARRLAYADLLKFFDLFYYYVFTDDESEAIMQAFVWPQLSRLSLESKCKPSPLLKLLCYWCQNERNFHFLTKEKTDGGGSGLKAMFSVLTSADVTTSVSYLILQAVENIIERQDKLPSTCCKNVKTEFSFTEVQMLKPYIPVLLTYIESSVCELNNIAEKSSTGIISTRENALLKLKILAKVSLFTDDCQLAFQLCSLLAQLLNNSLPQQQIVAEMALQSMLNLIRNVKDPQLFYRPLLPLFNSLEGECSRNLLCELLMQLNAFHMLKVIGEKVPNLKEITSSIWKLNAWNPRMLSEPDYAVRLESFRAVLKEIKDWKVLEPDILLPLIFNCLFFIRTFEDLSIRDISTHCIICIVEKFKCLEFDSEMYREIIVELIVKHMKKGLRSKNQHVRMEFLAIFQALVLVFSQCYEFKGLSALQDADIEADFFENIKHVQLHKQARSLRRLSHHLHTHWLSSEHHMGYFLPLLYSYLVEPQYAKSGKILDAATDLMCMICRQLPWERYYQVLRLYLTQLPRQHCNQKLTIRVIVAILDAFHFDLSKSQFKHRDNPILSNSVVEVNQEHTTLGMPQEEFFPSKDVTKDNKEKHIGDMHIEFTADKMDMCAPGLASRIHRMILRSLIPQLHHRLTERAKSDNIHKMAQSRYPEDDEIQRVPIAIAMIKLLRKLPDDSLKYRLPGIIMKVCNFLKSRAQSIRMVARDTLVKAIRSLGPKYLPFIIREMRQILTKGYQMHVLSFSAFHMLRSISDILKPGDIDAALDDLLSIYQEELFGSVAEEKKVVAITEKIFEAKTIKGYNAYKIIAENISSDLLGSLICPLKKVLVETHSQNVANKVSLALHSVCKGLLANTAVRLQTLMLFVHTLTADILPAMLPAKEVSEEDSSFMMLKLGRPKDCYLLDKEPSREGAKSGKQQKTTLDVLVEFGLKLLHLNLKNGTLSHDNKEHLGYLDPLVSTLLTCLSLKYVKVNAASLRCLEKLLVFPLPSLRSNIGLFSDKLFSFLQRYATSGASTQENKELASLCFKTVTVLVKDVKLYKPSPDQLQMLLSFCEEDIYNPSRQGFAFSLLKAIIRRGVHIPEIAEIISKVEKMSIDGDVIHLCARCREVVLMYLKSYPLGKKALRKHIAFYLNNLTYQMMAGRMSALAMIRSFFTSFDKIVIQEYSSMFFFPLSAILCDDISEACRSMASNTIKLLLEKIDFDKRDELYRFMLDWTSGTQLLTSCLAAQICCLFMEVEKSKFVSRRDDVFPLFFEKQLLHEDSERVQDSYNFQVLNMITTSLDIIDLDGLSLWTNINKVIDYVVGHMLHQHTWIRRLSCEIMGKLLSFPSGILPFLPPDQGNKIFKFLCMQLQSPLLDEELAAQIMKNCFYLAKMYHNEEVSHCPFSLNVLKMVRKLVREANYELANNQHIATKREFVMKFIGAVGEHFDPTTVTSLLPSVISLLQREEQCSTHSHTLKSLAEEVMSKLKNKCGVEAFSTAYTVAQTVLRNRRQNRKQKRAIDAVNKPEISAAKRIKKNMNRHMTKVEEKKKWRSKSKLSIYRHADD